MSLRLLAAIAVLLCVPCQSRASCNRWVFRQQPYFEPLIADLRSANISITALGWADAFPFAVNPGMRRVWDINLGMEIPILGCETSDVDPLGAGEWGWGIWTPVSFHMIEDFKDDSAPILNTDYRFSTIVKVQRGLTANSRLGFRAQFGHESTHVGDEFVIHALQTYGALFERVNVSYEYWEYGVSYEVDRGKHSWTFRHGGMGLLRPSKGYYSDQLLQIGGRTLPRSKRNFEPSFGAQWFMEKDLLKGYGPFVSTDLRPRIVYDYNRPSSSVKEDRQLSVNLLVGLRYLERKNPRSALDRGIPDFFLRVYHGVNPHGMFRSQRNFTMVGLGIHIPL